MIEEGASTRRLEVSRWKLKQPSIGRRAELVRRNKQLDEIRQIGIRGLVFNDLKVRRRIFY